MNGIFVKNKTSEQVQSSESALNQCWFNVDSMLCAQYDLGCHTGNGTLKISCSIVTSKVKIKNTVSSALNKTSTECCISPVYTLSSIQLNQKT